jgi:hypothetical protein
MRGVKIDYQRLQVRRDQCHGAAVWRAFPAGHLRAVRAINRHCLSMLARRVCAKLGQNPGFHGVGRVAGTDRWRGAACRGCLRIRTPTQDPTPLRCRGTSDRPGSFPSHCALCVPCPASDVLVSIAQRVHLPLIRL